MCILSATSREPAVRYLDPLTRLNRNAALLDEYGKTEDDNYMFMNGTSMAAPIVAGHIAVLREAYISTYGNDPLVTSAMLKALLIHGATDLSLSHGTYHETYRLVKAPNNVQGYGLANLEASISPILKATCVQEMLFADPDPLPFSQIRSINGSRVAPLSVATFNVNAPPIGHALGGGMFQATMVHIDFEGPALQHDVRMRVTINGNAAQAAPGEVTVGDIQGGELLLIHIAHE